jgi:membrane fusion protein (multidrug efflux system)
VLTTELAGRTQAFVWWRRFPQVGGIVQRRLFVEGADVKVGQALYQLMRRPIPPPWRSPRRVWPSIAPRLNPRRPRRRDAELVKINAISQQTNEDAQATLLTAAADVQVAEAEVQTARINLAYTRIPRRSADGLKPPR